MEDTLLGATLILIGVLVGYAIAMVAAKEGKK